MKNTSNKPEFQSDNSYLHYTGSAIFGLGLIFCVINHAHLYIIAPLILLLIISVFNERYNVLIFEDRFIIRTDYLPGKLLRINQTFYFKDVKSFSFETNIWKPKLQEILAIVFLHLFLTQQFFGSNPKKIFLSISYQTHVAKIKHEQITLPAQDSSFVELMEIIKSRIG